MAFWESRTGEALTGNPEDSFNSGFQIIPDGTTAKAMIKIFEPKEINGEKFYQITWKIVSDKFKNAEVRQKLNVFDTKPERAQRSLNMMMLIYNLFEYKPTHNNAPSIEELKIFSGKMAGIKIQEWEFEGKQGNRVSEVYQLDENFMPEVGIKLKKVTSTPTRHSSDEILNLDMDVPF